MLVIEALRAQRRASFVARTRFDKSRLSFVSFLWRSKEKKRDEGLSKMSNNSNEKPELQDNLGQHTE